MNNWMVQLNKYLKKQPQVTAFLAKLLNASVFGFYMSFMIQTMVLLINDSLQRMLVFVVGNAIVFILVTLLRSVINRKRPYETLGIAPVIPKNTKGKSFPSRHAFCAWLIALNWLIVFHQPLSLINGTIVVIYCIFAFIVSVLRVILTLHYPSDVIAGATLALICFIVMNRVC